MAVEIATKEFVDELNIVARADDRIFVGRVRASDLPPHNIFTSLATIGRILCKLSSDSEFLDFQAIDIAFVIDEDEKELNIIMQANDGGRKSDYLRIITTHVLDA